MRIWELWVKALVGENDASIIVAAYCDIFPRAAGHYLLLHCTIRSRNGAAKALCPDCYFLSFR